MKKKTFLFTLLAFILANVSLFAQCPIAGYSYLGEYGGHHYYLSTAGTSAPNAHVNAAALGAYLASITSAGENTFIANNVPGYVTIGFNDVDSEGDFVWPSGEAVSFTSWWPGEPNDAGDEDWTVINFGATGAWNDIPVWVSPLYVVEFEDGDGDGTSDYCDACPDDPGKTEPGICGCGVADVDSDCDGVMDCFDICPGGNDVIDNNADGIPDCSQLLNYGDYDASWYCGKNKIMVCHNDNNQHTICINKNALAAHFNHGDQIGPCSSCGGSLKKGSGIHSKSGSAQAEGDQNKTIGFSVLPNPANEFIDVNMEISENEKVLDIISNSGIRILHKIVDPQQTQLRVDLAGQHIPSGQYLVRLIMDDQLLYHRIVLIK